MMKKQVDIETEKKAIQAPSLAQDIIQLLLKIVIIIFAIYQPIAALKIFSLFFINLSTAFRPHFLSIHSIAS